MSSPQMDIGLEKVQDLKTMPISLTHLVNEHKFKSTSISPSPRYFVLKSAATDYTIFEFKSNLYQKLMSTVPPCL